MDECPYCGNDANDYTAKCAIIEVLKSTRYLGSHCDPGGREFKFSFGSVHVSDYCYHCDLRKIKEFVDLHRKIR